MPTPPVVYYVAFFETCYDSLDDAIAKAPDTVAAHRARSQELHARGTLLMSGAFLGHPGGEAQRHGRPHHT